jgi:hypothetical protein
LVVQPIYLTVAVEGLVDEAVARKIVESVGATAARTYGRTGKAHLSARLPGYNRAANHSPWFVVMDLDNDECAPRLRTQLLPNQSERMCLRIAVKEVEAWLLADREEMAHFLRVAVSRVPTSPDEAHDSKQSIVQAARHSSHQAIRADIVPRSGSGRAVGPAYPSRMIEFVERWRPEVAAQRSDSLSRCLTRLGELVEGERARL